MHGKHGHEHQMHTGPTSSAKEQHTGNGSSRHDQHAGHSPEMFRDRFVISLLLTLPVVFWSAHIEELLGYTAPRFAFSDWIPPALGTLVFLYGGLVFLRSAVGELRSLRPGMMTLISLAITVAFVFSWVVALGGIDADALWWELATLVTVMLLGHWIEMRSINQAKGALKELAKLLPDEATCITDGGTASVSVSALRGGDRLLIRPGERVPADGTIDKGSSSLDEAVITGESRPVQRGAGESVIAGTINGDGVLEITITVIPPRQMNRVSSGPAIQIVSPAFIRPNCLDQIAVIGSR